MIKIEETDSRFYIAESKLPGAGLGCFAKVKIQKGDYLEIIGVMIKYGGIADQCTHFCNRYKFSAEPEKEFKHALVPMGYAAIINQANEKEQQNVAITHLPKKSKRNNAATRAIYLALRDIEPNEELLGNYNKKIGHLAVDGRIFTEEQQTEWLNFIKSNFYELGVLHD